LKRNNNEYRHCDSNAPAGPFFLLIFNLLVATGLAPDWTIRNPEDVPWTPLDLGQAGGVERRFGRLPAVVARCWRGVRSAAEPTPAVSCAMAAALLIWSRQVVEPAARRHLGVRPQTLRSLGSWNCRRVAGTRHFSEHATANAIDIGGIGMAGSRRIGISADWDGDPHRTGFLHAIRDGGCRLFRTVLSPDYNAAHGDHLHLDMGPWRDCS
jgi:hypothetical protein